MKTRSWNKPTRAIVTALLASGALLGAGSAFAQAQPYALTTDTSEAVGEAHLLPVDLHVSIGWHGNRYWDGHRYWAHDDWMHRHPHDPGPPRGRDDRRPPPGQHY
ncbi:hypothetical protein CY652_08610 [Burkholderia sp. WAC0059]|uniref:hypothetical protein n=1 Tax=Burkholderia sp. WAC0059 TaxID=2066022 RepID=UPI000C7F780A|nr:hypothetical protein [Burkholderia sp. WAC0059]PLZ02965.1 hypothetical protein CY652_08610 [Burkholderia sp. WAC0059]